MKKLKTILQSKYLFKIIGLIFLIYAIFEVNFFPKTSIYSEKNTEVIGKVTKYEIDGNQCTIYLKGNEKILIYYYFQNKAEKEYYEKNLELGSTLKVQGNFQKPSKNTIPNGFNYRKYLQYHQIYYIVESHKISIEQNNISILYHIKNKMINRIDKIDNKGYLRTFLLGDKSLMDENTLKEYQHNGVSHLFSISGMHVSLIVSVILFVLDRISYHRIYKYSIILPILLLYLFLTNFSASITRTIIMFILFAVNQCLCLKIRKVDILILTLIIVIIINSAMIYDIGFQFSYIISGTLILFSQKINQIKNKVIKNLMTSWICFLVSLPICIYYFYQVNILSILLNLIMIPLISIIIFPITIITFIFPIIYPFYQAIIHILETINHLANSLNFFEVVLAKPPLITIYIYYGIIYLSFWHRKFLSLFFLIIFIHKIFPYWNQQFIFTTLDVGQGDALFVKFPSNYGNILIDTGGKVKIEQEKWQQKKNSNTIATSKIIPYLKSLGINKLNYLILTHGDYDHMGESINLVNNFKVEKVILGCGEYNDLEKELMQVLDKKKIKYYSCIRELNIDKYKLQFLNTKEYDNENDNSNVIYLNYNNYKFLFMGDAGIEKEKDILEKYNLKNIDFLKVGHHGSNTSSSEEFIDSINPKYSLISVGKNNRYGHPKASVLNILNNSQIYRTDLNGSIEIKLKQNRYKIRTCPP